MINFINNSKKQLRTDVRKMVRKAQPLFIGLMAFLLVVSPYFSVSFDYQNVFASDNNCVERFLNFDQYQKGDRLSGSIEGYGVFVSVESKGDHDVLMIFDSDTSPYGEDKDLRTDDNRYGENNDEALDKILIISEDNNASSPDDEKDGGTMTFVFDKPVKVGNLGFLDIEESGGKVTAYNQSDEVIAIKSIIQMDDNSAQTVNVDTAEVKKLTVKLSGSGALTSINYCVPQEVVDPCANNSAPKAVISEHDGTISLGNSMTFSATESTDADGDALKYTWEVSGMGIVSNEPTYTFSPSELGNYNVSLTVSDNCIGDMVSTTLTVEQPKACEFELTKSATPESTGPGGQIFYTINLKNTGTANCTGGGVELKEYYDDLTSYVSSSPNPFSGDNIWNFGTVEPGEEHTIEITMDVSENAQDGDVITNKACVWASEFGSKDEAGNWQCVTVDTPVEEENQCVDNESPTPVISPENATITLGETINFTNESTDPEGDTLQYTWAVNQLGVLEDTENFSFTPSEVGEYIVTLKAFDGCSYEVVWTTVYVVEPEVCVGNEAPVAVINPATANILVGETVNFNPTGSSDPEGDTMAYSWRVEGDDQIFLQENFDFTPNTTGEYTIVLTVADSCGSDEVSAVVNVAETNQCLGHVNPNPVITPANPTITIGNSVNFSSDESTDADGDDFTLEWFVDGNSVSTDPEFTYTPDSEGVYTVELRAADQCGQALDETTLVVNGGGGGSCAGNTLPVAVAGDDIAVDINNPINLNASNSHDADGDTLTYTWEVPSVGFISNDAVTSLTISTNNPEKHIATLTVSDSCGSSTDTLEINVHSGGGGGGGPQCTSSQPTAVAGPDIAVAPGQVFTLDGTGSSDPEGDVLQYIWRIEATNFEALTPTTSTSISQTGTYIAKLTVGDACNSHTDELQIEVVTGSGGGCTENCGGGGGGGTPPTTPTNPPTSPNPTPQPEPIVLATSTTQTFTAPTTSPRAGSPLPLEAMGLGLLAGMVTTFGAYFISRRRMYQNVAV